MNLTPNQRIKTDKPVYELYEDGEWLMIQDQFGKRRYLRKELGERLLYQIGLHSVTEKSDIIVRV